MQQSTTKALYSVHAWTGIVTGLMLFLICFSGAIVVFKHEIDLWANPSLRALPQVETPASLDTVHAALQAHVPPLELNRIVLPGPHLPAYIAFARTEAGAPVKLALHPETGALLGPVDSELGQFIRSLHVFLLFGPRWIVGFFGVVMLVSIATGVLIHQKILKQLFTQRWTSSLRLMISDAHKLIGVWALLFHVLIAFTGAWLGLAPLFTNAARYVLGAAPAAESVLQPAAPSTMQPLTLDELLAEARRQLPTIRIESLQPSAWGTPKASALFISGRAGADNGLRGHVSLRAADGAVLVLRDPRDAGFWARVDGWMSPLHFGDFGGLPLKWLYFILGLTPALLSLSGTWLWLERSRSERMA